MCNVVHNYFPHTYTEDNNNATTKTTPADNTYVIKWLSFTPTIFLMKQPQNRV